ncbi:hypothetical protein KAFR_0B05550 [Kazachstania africana CBS 2517]|uniref:GPI transamidase component GAA1 n=1 Tax=Kazachstania africana (strain ATCC 22294 / BCRC 22015 / CBS 2517 / CECT 1963 / NBRC 1671 / NRRL Y-8276) TaxID=1071382 RepID=H2AR50_KAZAF|nr:hypothetical protein KAFR_0B05550 [Kazachstania africana CBS 2517]CCF56850.1 hypothetical protein KAFR_0B05550 [Kazachstania africana CBS 2517]
MGLVERVKRQVAVMGLVPKLKKYLPLFSKIIALISLISIAILPIDGQYRNTYISENALMPSQAYSYFRETEWNILRGYRTQVENMVDLPLTERNDIMETWLNDIGAKTDTHNNSTIYGIFHSPRGDGTEAIVLAIPWHNSEGQFNTGGAALGVSLARFFWRWPIWSKNIIVVFSEDTGASLRSWVEAYHTSLDLTGGSIEAAVILDYASESDFFDYVEIHYDGLNGELPNLDLVNIAVSITEHEGMKVSLHGLPREELEERSLWSRFKMLLRSIKDSSLAGIKKPHGNEAFSGWRIQALTLKACGEGGIDITTFGRIPEAMFRSINNLLEKFHQSFFYYLLLAPRNFVSISSYLPAAVGLSLAFACSSLGEFVNDNQDSIPFISSYTLEAIIVWFLSITFSFCFAITYLKYTFPVMLMFICILFSFIPLISRGLPLAETKITVAHRMKAFAFGYFSLVLTSLLMINFPLALTIGVLAFPMTLVKISNTLPTSSQALKNSMLLLVSNPYISICAFSNIFDSELTGLATLDRLIPAWNDMNCWTWFFSHLAGYHAGL